MPYTAKHVTGILAIRVSTIGAADEKHWATAEEHLNGSATLQLQANFGPGSAGVSIPWATAINTQDADMGQLRRDAKVVCHHVYSCAFITAVLDAVGQQLPNALSLPSMFSSIFWSIGLIVSLPKSAPSLPGFSRIPSSMPI